jgi:hypothetical protein
MPHELRLFADYSQIHVSDDGGDGDLSDAWTEEASDDRLAIARGVAGIGTVVNVYVAVSLEILETEPAVVLDGFDHVVEGAFEVRSGTVVVMGCTDYFPEAARFGVPAGWTRIRASGSNLDAAARAQVDSDEDPATTERVLIQLWPGEPGPTIVRQRWTPPAAGEE